MKIMSDINVKWFRPIVMDLQSNYGSLISDLEYDEFRLTFKIKMSTNSDTRFNVSILYSGNGKTDIYDVIYQEYDWIRTFEKLNLVDVFKLFIPFDNSSIISDGCYKVLRECKRGDYVKLKPCSKKVFRFDGYDRSMKKYALTSVDDVFGDYKFVKGDKYVWSEFIY